MVLAADDNDKKIGMKYESKKTAKAKKGGVGKVEEMEEAHQPHFTLKL